MQGDLHPSLRTYVECFNSPPFPKMWPRGGGLWDQDPILVRDFRIIRDLEIKWKDNQERMQEARSGNQGGGDPGLTTAVEEYLQNLEEEGETPFF